MSVHPSIQRCDDLGGLVADHLDELEVDEENESQPGNLEESNY